MSNIIWDKRVGLYNIQTGFVRNGVNESLIVGASRISNIARKISMTPRLLWYDKLWLLSYWTRCYDCIIVQQNVNCLLCCHALVVSWQNVRQFHWRPQISNPDKVKKKTTCSKYRTEIGWLNRVVVPQNTNTCNLFLTNLCVVYNIILEK